MNELKIFQICRLLADYVFCIAMIQLQQREIRIYITDFYLRWNIILQSLSF